MTKENRPSMALWLKVTIAVLVVGLISFIILLVAGGMFLIDNTKKAMDPKYNAGVADSVVKVEEPLPSGFTRIIAMDFLGMKEVGYSNMKEGLSIILMKLESKGGSADSFVENYSNSGTNPGAPRFGINDTSGLPLVVKGRGKMIVGGENMPYVIGERSVNGAKVAQLVGCVIPHDTVGGHGRMAVVVLGQNSRAGDYKLELTKKFLRAVQGF